MQLSERNDLNCVCVGKYARIVRIIVTERFVQPNEKQIKISYNDALNIGFHAATKWNSVHLCKEQQIG